MALCGLLVATTFSSGTAYYAVRKDGALYIGEDTLIRIDELDSSENHCKMFVNQRYALAIAGDVAAYTYSPADNGETVVHFFYNLDAGANDIFTRGASPEAIVTQMIDAIESFQRKTLDTIEGRSVRQQHYQGISATLFWFAGRKPMMERFSVAPVVREGGVAFDVRTTPPEEIAENALVTDTNAFHRAATDEETLRRVKAEPDPVRRLNELLKQESEFSTDAKGSQFVGPPFTIVRLRSSGAVWMQEGSFCKENTHFHRR